MAQTACMTPIVGDETPRPAGALWLGHGAGDRHASNSDMLLQRRNVTWRAKGGLIRGSKVDCYSITSSARAISIGGTLRPTKSRDVRTCHFTLQPIEHCTRDAKWLFSDIFFFAQKSQPLAVPTAPRHAAAPMELGPE